MALSAMTHERQPVLSPQGLSPLEKTYKCVEFKIVEMGAVYLSRIWDVPARGLCFLVKEESAVLGHLNDGDIVHTHFLGGGSTPDLKCQSRIRGITREIDGRFRGHYLIGLEPMHAGAMESQPH